MARTHLVIYLIAVFKFPVVESNKLVFKSHSRFGYFFYNKYLLSAPLIAALIIVLKVVLNIYICINTHIHQRNLLNLLDLVTVVFISF